jgi:hypothetical protein
MAMMISPVKIKFIFLQNILENMFIDEPTKTKYLTAFSSAQKTYFALNRFVYLIKLKRKECGIDTDLYLNPINETMKSVMVMLQDNKKYLFTVKDLVNICESALLNSPSFFSEPLPAKNPYTNVPFTKTQLYNIYFFLKDRLLRMSTIIEQFFLCNLHLGRFQEKNISTIRYYAIERYLKNCSEYTLIMHINDMLKKFRRPPIDPSFPRNTLFIVMRPYLFLYLLGIYGFDVSSKKHANEELCHKLIRFYRFNPRFGRKIIVLKDTKISGSYYVEDHIEFNENEEYFCDFDTSHLDY